MCSYDMHCTYDKHHKCIHIVFLLTSYVIFFHIIFTALFDAECWS